MNSFLKPARPLPSYVLSLSREPRDQPSTSTCLGSSQSPGKAGPEVLMREGVVEEEQPLAWGLPALLWLALLALGLSRAWPLAQRSHFSHPPHLPGGCDLTGESTSWTPGRPGL